MYYILYTERCAVVEIEGLLVRDSQEELCCVLEQDTLSYVVRVQPGRQESAPA